MTDETVKQDAQRLRRALPMYLAAQVATLLFTSLDGPVYLETYRANHFLTVSGWLGAWFALVIFGVMTAVFLLVRKSWRILFEERARTKLALTYLLGGLMGLLTLGIRFLPIVPPQYFVAVGGFALISIAAYLVWKTRVRKVEELFP